MDPPSVTNTALHINTGTGQVTVDASSQRYKYDIQDANINSEVIDNLRPVTFKWKVNDRQDLGFIAEEVNEHLPIAVNKNQTGDPESLQDRALIALLVKEVQKLRQEVNELKSKIN